MNQNVTPQQHLEKLFEKKKCYTIEELHKALNYSLISIRRFLKKIGYYSSFTHNSKWYTLKAIPSFDNNGIWFYRDKGFSVHGNLNQTILHFVNKSSKGLSAKELINILSVPCHSILNQMYNKKKIDRLKTSDGFYYLTINENKKKMQIKKLQIIASPKKIARLLPQTAVYVLVEFIKNPEASFLELSIAVEKKGVKVSQTSIARLFKEHDLKKIPE